MVKTRYRMDETTALEAHPGAVRAPGATELRNVLETGTELQADFAGAWLRSK